MMMINTCYKSYSKLLNVNLQIFPEQFMTGTQNGFRKGRSCVDPTFGLKLLTEERREYNLEAQFLFLYYEKEFDVIQRQIVFDSFKI